MLHHFSNLYSCALLHCSTAQTTRISSSVECSPRSNGPSAQPCTKVTTHCFVQHRNPWCVLQVRKNFASKYDRQLWIQWAWDREQPTTLLFWRLKEGYQFLTVKDTPLRNDSQDPKGNICRFRRRRASSWLAQYWPLKTDFSSRSRQRGTCADRRIKYYMVQTFLTALD
jgi:hypothetical protein